MIGEGTWLISIDSFSLFHIRRVVIVMFFSCKMLLIQIFGQLVEQLMSMVSHHIGVIITSLKQLQNMISRGVVSEYELPPGFYVLNHVKEEALKKAKHGKLYYRHASLGPPKEPDLESPDTLDVIYYSGLNEGTYFCDPYYGLLWKPLIVVCDELKEEMKHLWDFFGEKNPLPIDLPVSKSRSSRKKKQEEKDEKESEVRSIEEVNPESFVD